MTDRTGSFLVAAAHVARQHVRPGHTAEGADGGIGVARQRVRVVHEGA